MRLLFTTWDGGGNTPPLMALARRMVAGGHNVRILGEAGQRAWAEDTGARFLELPPHVADEPGGASFASYWFSRRFVAGTAEALDAEGAEVVVADNMTPPALLVAEQRGIPRVALFHQPWSFYERGHVMGNLFADGQDMYSTVRGELGLPPLAHAQEAWETCAAVIVPSARSFDLRCAKDLPANVHHVGPLVDHPPHTAVPVDLPPDDRPLVLVSLSTTGMGADELLSSIASALARRHLRAIVTSGWAIDPATVPGANNVAVARYLPHEAALASAAAAVHHAGHGTTMASLTHGVPMVCVPLGRDQHDMAEFVAELGAGVVVDASLGGEAVAQAVETVLADPTFRAVAQGIAETIDLGAGLELAARVLERAATGEA